ncbi:MAG: hypothetical protein E6X17_14845 [Sporomusaceae bacterium]|nr:hypothetical protein [Sporomusaceae bacterium]
MGAEEGGPLRTSDGGIQYILYDWQGKCKWAYLEGNFLVDPRFEAEFLSSREKEAAAT